MLYKRRTLHTRHNCSCSQTVRRWCGYCKERKILSQSRRTCVVSCGALKNVFPECQFPSPSLTSFAVKSDGRFGLNRCPSVARRYQEGSMTTSLPLFVFLRTFGQVFIFADVVRKDEYASLGCALGIRRVAQRDPKPKSRESPAVRWRKSVDSLSCCRDRRQHVEQCDQQARLSTLSKGYLNWLNGRFKRCVLFLARRLT